MTRAFFALPILFAAACSTSSTGTSNDDLTAEDYDDTAQAVSSAAAGDGNGGDLAAMSDSANIALGVLPLGFTLNGSGEINGNRLGVSYNFSIRCEDANGDALSPCDERTDSADVEVAWSGTLDTSHFDASVERDGSWSISGLQSNVVTFDGDSSFSYDATLLSIFRPGAQSSFSFDASASYDAVAIDGATHDAIDGTASFSIDARKIVTGTSNDVDKSFSVDATIEFHANRTATLTLDGDHVYTLNTATGVVVRAN
jgi:hypothetical protein